MKQNEKIQTRKDEVRFKTSDIRRIIGKYLATNVLRTWNEDFVDDDTGEVVTIERNEILFERGKYIDNDLATEINFYLQSEDVKEVEKGYECGILIDGFRQTKAGDLIECVQKKTVTRRISKTA
jgi:hypothetical protein